MLSNNPLSSVFNPATEQPEAVYINGGGSRAYGLELSGVVQPEIFNKQLYFNGSFSYNKATLADGFGTNPKGSREADSPLWLASTGITYEPTSWLVANISAKYTGTRYNDYAESIKLDSYTVVSSYLDIGGANNFGLPENVSLRFNIDNLFDKKVLSYVSAGSTSFRPLSPRTFQASVTVAF
ncbi:MAG: TonB-dependent receptor [Chromatiaceae bacterium]|nr:TonB-dependent receptor [Chromatiaceae bacterium]